MAKEKRLSNFGLLSLVWRITRKFRGVCYGPEFILAIVAWLLTSPYWLMQAWWDQVISTLPTILGLTVSGFAVFLGFGSDDFKRFLSKGKDPDDNSYMSVGAAFVFFVFVQLLAVLFALVVKGFQFPTPDFLLDYKKIINFGNYVAGAIGYFLFIYSLALSLRASLRIFRLSRWYSRYLIKTDPDRKPVEK
ncbi:hypothetical protein [Kerstersia gyiorum]|uniref:hypothetical protein n=1 Tax=Kerstersia gyiorum TaxID=206506 RepID=UPI00128FE63F|nr:hypothetical protein [Kerstersia gyiorum]